MRKNKIGLIFIMLLMGYSSFGQNGEVHALKESNNIPNKNTSQTDTIKQYADYKMQAIQIEILQFRLEDAKQEIAQLKNENEKLELLNERHKLHNIYKQIREKIESKKQNYSDFEINFVRTYINEEGIKKIVLFFDKSIACSECVALFLNNKPNFKKQYPFIYKAVSNGTIVLDTNYTNRTFPILEAQLIRNKLPLSEVINVNPPKTNTTLQALAEHYLVVIKKIHESNYFDFDVYTIYKRMEEMKPNNKDLAVLIELREFYIKDLEKNYLKQQQKLRNENK